MYTGNRNRLLCSAIVASSFAVPTAYAQTGATEEVKLEEIVVTAERREENLQKMALAITALSGADLTSEGKNKLEDAIATVPGVRIQDNGLTGGTPFIRGVGPALGTDPSAAVSLDGVYQSDGLFGSQFDVARVEVLRGPQGTLYGRNATAGSVNVITNNPTDKYEGSAGVQVGNYNSIRVEGMLNVPLSENFSVRTAFLSSKHDGYMSNGTMDEDTQAGRIKFKYTPSDAMTILLAADHVTLGGYGQGNTQAPISAHADDPWRTTDLPGRQNSKRTSVYGQLDLDLGFGVLTYQPAWYDNQVYGDFNFLGSRNLVVSSQRNLQHTEELRLASAENQSLKWLVGAFYLDNKGRAYPIAPQLAAGAHSTPSNNAITPTEAESRAIFGQMTFPIADSFRLIAGARYTWDDKSAARTTWAGTIPGSAIVSVSSPVKISTNKFTYKAGLEYDVTNDSMLYATYSTGFKSGGINDPTASVSTPSAYAVYQPEELKAFEIGSKSRFLDSRLQLNVAAFYYDYANYQVFTVSFGPIPPIVAVLNAASATLWGAEVESSFLVTNNDRLDASVAYNNNKFDTFTYFTDSYPPPTGLDRSGTQLPQAPAWTELLGYEHTFDLSDGAALSLGAQGRFYSQSDVSIEPALDSHQPAYALVDANATYKPGDGNWSLNAYVNNATNKAVRQFTQELGIFNIHELRIGAPRTYGVGITARF